jgi:hypothetical protein
MRPAVASLIAALFALPALHAEGYGPGLTVLVDFERAAPNASVGEMRREVQHLLKPSGLNVDVRLRSDVQPGENFADLVLVRVKGSCDTMPDPMLVDERGPQALARSYTVAGQVQPFGEVSCDRVRRAVDSALWAAQRAERDQLLGRALGRVVAHELVHMVARTGKHSNSGVFQESLSGAQLIGEGMQFNPADLERLRKPLTSAAH